MSSSLDRILSSPGLHFLFSDILLLLDLDSFVVASSLVSRGWTGHVVENRLWRRVLLGRSVAPKGSYFRALLEERCPEFRRIEEDEDVSLEEASRVCRRLCWRIHRGLSREWMRKDFRVHRVSDARIVRDLRVTDAAVAFATGSTVSVAERLHLCRSMAATGDNDLTSSSSFASVQLPVCRVLDGTRHRREINCFDLDVDNDVMVCGGRDRKVSFWRASTAEMLDCVAEAHRKLVTCVRLSGRDAFTASRDHTVKIWRIPSDENAFKVSHLQTLCGHSHSVWDVSVSDDDAFLASGSADKTIRVWTKKDAGNEGGGDTWKEYCLFADHSTGVRNLCLLRCNPNFLLSGDLFGELKVWNVAEKRLQYNVPEQEGTSWFRHTGAVVSISECLFPSSSSSSSSSSGGFVAVAFGNHCVCLYMTGGSLVEDGLRADRVIRLEPLVEPGLVRCVVAKPTELFICNFSGKDGIIVLDIWE